MSNSIERGTDQSKRVRVAMTGLASVLVLIGVAAAIFHQTSTEPAVVAVGAARPETVANMADVAVDNLIAKADEPLAELGVAPGSASVDANAMAPAGANGR